MMGISFLSLFRELLLFFVFDVLPEIGSVLTFRTMLRTHDVVSSAVLVVHMDAFDARDTITIITHS